MQLDESSSRTLDSLPPRPPTPPRDSQSHAFIASRPSLFNRLFSKSLGAQTPPNLSPGSAAGAESSPSERATRRVAWSASTDYRDHDELSKNPREINSNLRLIPSSVDRPLPPKSILKQNNGDAVNRQIDFYIPPHEHTPETFATMLESVTKQLAGDDRLSRIDAYMSLSGLLKATDSIPDAEALRNKMGLLTQFVRRDMEARQADGEVDKVLVNNALTLLASLLWKNEQFSQEFAIFVLEHTITSFEHKTMPKDVAKHLMFIIGQQNFSPKIVTVDRATRLLKATCTMQDYYKGKSIELGRLSIYKKLLQQAKPVMLANTVWLKHAFDDMLNPDKHVRIPVIDFGIEAALTLGTEKHGSRAFTELFDSHYDENIKYADYYHTRLLRMLQAKGDNATLEKSAVPRIWSILILFLRYKPAQLDKWAHWTSYLHILQKCFNSSDQEVKAQANIAWNRLVFALQPDATEEKRKLNRQLLQPFLGQLHAKRKHVGKGSKEMFQITVSSACNLLYYALRPGASHASLDLLWDLYVPPLIQQLSDTDSSAAEQKAGAASCEGSNQAIAVLHALLSPTPRAKQPWRIDRAMSDERMRFDELSPIDSKWVRANSSRVLAVLQPLLRRRFKDLSVEESRLKDLWKGFLLSIAAAGSKEIITSHETMQCIAQVFTMAHTLWQKQACHDIITQEGQSTGFLDGFVYLVTEMVKALSMLPFWEKRLSVEDINPFAVVATPSTSSRKAPKAAKTAVQCLVALLVAPGVAIESNFALKGALRRLLLPFHQFRVRNGNDFEFCKELFETLPSLQSAFNKGAAEAVWCVIATYMRENPEAYADGRNHGSSGSTPSSQLLGVTFRDRIRVLEYGAALLHHDSVSEWQELYFQISLSASDQVGAGGHALAVVEPLARCLQEYYRPTEGRSYITLFSTIVGNASYPSSEQSLEAARRKLWGATTATSRPSIDPFKHLYAAINFFLAKAYEMEGSSVEVSNMLEHIGGFIRNCLHGLQEALLQTLGDGLALWLRDADDVMNSADSHSSIKHSMQRLWDDVRSAIDTRVGHNDLTKLKTVLVAALSSRHKFVVSSAIELWNERFGVLDGLHYPNEVAESLARLRTSANLLLPNFPDIADNEVPPAAISFMDSDDSDPIEYASTGGPRGRSLTPSILGSSPFKARSSPAVNLGLPRSSINHQLLEVSSTASSRKKAVKQDTTPRLRHDDSQIKFAAIEATPEPADAESQLLTDHQREIRERQEEENAAMFADLRSSPKPTEKKKEKKRLSLTTDKPLSQEPGEEQISTPSVTSAMRTLDDWVTSSPTPQSRKKKHVQAEEDLPEVEEEPVEIPSSPPNAAGRSPSPAERSRTPSPHSRSIIDVELVGQKSKGMEVPTVHPPGPSGVDSPPSFANLVDHLAAESVTNSSPAVPSARLSLSQLTKGSRKRHRSPEKKASPEEEDGDEVMEGALAIALSPTTATEIQMASQMEKDIAPSQSHHKTRKRSRSKSSQNNRKSQEHQTTGSLFVVDQPQQELPPTSAQEERRRSSSLSELDESMVQSLEATHSVDDGGQVRYIELKPDQNFSPEQYAKVDVFSSPAKTPEPEALRKETRIVPPARSSTTKPKASAKKGDGKEVSELAAVRTTRGAQKRKSTTRAVETTVATLTRASSRLRQVEPPEVMDLEEVDPSLARSGGKLSRSQRKAAFAESTTKTPAARSTDKHVEFVEETPAPQPNTTVPATQTPKKSHKKKVVENEREEEVPASLNVMETWMRKETPVPVPVPTRKRKTSQQVEREPEPEREPVEMTATVDTVAKSSRNKRRKRDEKRLQPQVVEDSQQDHGLRLEHEGTTVPPLSQVQEKPEKSSSSSTFRTAKTVTGSQSSKVEPDAAATEKNGRRRGKKGRWAADRSVVESSQQAEEEERDARLREQQVSDEAMPDADVDTELRSQPADAEGDAVSIASSHLEVEDAEEVTTVRYINRRSQLRREVSKSKSPSKSGLQLKSQTPAEAAAPDTDMAEAEVEAQLQSSIRHASIDAEAGTPPRKRPENLMEALNNLQQERGQEQAQEGGHSGEMWLLAHNSGQEVTHSSPASNGNWISSFDAPSLGEYRMDSETLSSGSRRHFGHPRETSNDFDTRQRLALATPAQQDSSVWTLSDSSWGAPSPGKHQVGSETRSPGNHRHSSGEQQQQHFTSSPPPQLTQEEQRMLDEAREGQRKRSGAPSTPPSQVEGGFQQGLLEKAEVVESEAAVAEAKEAEGGDSSSEDDSGENFEPSSSQTPHLLKQVSQSLSQHVETVAKQPSSHPTPPVRTQEHHPEPPSAPTSSAPASTSVAEKRKEELTYENISAVFQHGIEMLNRCEKGIRRHHVVKMEEMVFDIKAAMYNAEKRSREGLSEEERRVEFGRL